MSEEKEVEEVKPETVLDEGVKVTDDPEEEGVKVTEPAEPESDDSKESVS